MVDVALGNIYVTDGTISGNTITGGTTVTISVSKIDWNYDNQMSVIPIPTSKGGRDDLVSGNQEGYSRVVDLKRFKDALSIQGFLVDEASESAETKRDNLLKIAKTSGALKVVWGLTPYQTKFEAQDDPKDGTGMFITKMTFTEYAGLIGDNVTAGSQPERAIDCQVQLVRGKDM